ncbi:Hypothetical predicted protein [Mytilus galloprovincialis]|uniref:DDE-1 domain-containing protein n=1 Tax=Mytilus galloprovincialis TaxID=29158 RepID=A0A8B6GXD2_MYTGA|nr:Hypothetical predicted protein [Mytilus galloprovincialis]
MVIVRGKTSKSLNAFNVSEGVPNTKYTYQKCAWMEDVSSETWFRDHSLRLCGPDRPQIILLDSHSSHETLDLIEVARENGQNKVTSSTVIEHTTTEIEKKEENTKEKKGENCKGETAKADKKIWKIRKHNKSK